MMYKNLNHVFSCLSFLLPYFSFYLRNTKYLCFFVFFVDFLEVLCLFLFCFFGLFVFLLLLETYVKGVGSRNLLGRADLEGLRC